MTLWGEPTSNPDYEFSGRTGSTAICTVRDACAAYVKKLQRDNSADAAKDAEGVFQRLGLGSTDKHAPDPIAGIDLVKSKPANVVAWRERIFKRGSKAYCNRNMMPLRAALSYAYDQRMVASDFAWSRLLRRVKLDDDEGRRTLYLDPKERRALIEHASTAFKPLLISWLLAKGARFPLCANMGRILQK